MTEEGIVKALRACGRNDCDNCPCYGFLGNAACRRKNLDAAALIEAQAAEIEKLKAQEVKNVALQFQLTHLKKLRQHDDEQYVVTESVGNVMLMGFTRAESRLRNK